MIYNHLGVDFKYEYSNTGWWFQPTPLKYMSSSVGMMTFPIYMEKCSKPPTRTS